MSEYTMSKAQLLETVEIRNNTSGPVGYAISELKLSRLIQPNEEIEIPVEELMRLFFAPGGKTILKFLLPTMIYEHLISSYPDNITLDDIIEESALIENSNSNNSHNIMLVSYDSNTGAIDKSYNEIHNAIQNKILPMLLMEINGAKIYGYLLGIGSANNQYNVSFLSFDVNTLAPITFKSTDSDDYMIDSRINDNSEPAT